MTSSLLKVIDRMYQIGLKKFPESTILRLSYAFFLLERMRNRRKAIHQLLIAETTVPQFDEQFLIYRYKKIITENLDEMSEQNSDIVKIIAFDNHITQCEEYMLASAQLQKDFWAELREEQPELQKLNIIGLKINQFVNQAKDHYNKMQRINSNVPQTIKIYARFVNYILNDKEIAEKLFERSKNLYKEKQLAKIDENKELGEINLETEPTPYIIVSGWPDELGSIQKINALFSVLFWIYKRGISGYFNNLSMGEVESSYINNSKYWLVKNKNGYLFPVICKVVVFNEEPTFLGTFKSDVTLKNYIYLIVNSIGIITDISSSAISNLNLDIPKVKKNKPHIESIIPGALSEKKFFDKYGGELIKETKEYRVNVKHTFRVFITRIEYKTNYLDASKGIANSVIKLKGELLGYMVKMERIEKETFGFEPFLKLEKGSSSQVVIPEENDDSQSESPFKKKNFSDLIYSMYDNVLANLDSKDNFNPNKILDHKNSVIYQQQFYDYGKGIRTKKLIKNMIEDPFYEDDEVEVDEEEEFHDLLGSSSLIIGNDDDDDKNSKVFLHSNINTVIKTVLNTKFNHRSIKIFKLISLSWILLMLILSGLQNQASNIKIGEYNLITDILVATNNRFVESGSAVNTIFDLMLLNKLSILLI